MAPYDGTAMAPRPLHPAVAPWCHVQSAKVVRRPLPLLEVRTPIAIAIWGKKLAYIIWVFPLNGGFRTPHFTPQVLIIFNHGKPHGLLGKPTMTTSGCLQHQLAIGKLHAFLLQAKEILMKPLRLLRQGVEHLGNTTQWVYKKSAPYATCTTN